MVSTLPRWKAPPAPGSPHWNAEQHDRALQFCEELAARRHPKDRARIYASFFGPQPKVKRGRGGRRKRQRRAQADRRAQ